MQTEDKRKDVKKPLMKYESLDKQELVLKQQLYALERARHSVPVSDEDLLPGTHVRGM